MSDPGIAGRRQPTLDDIEHILAEVVDGSVSRDEADRWAARWAADDHLQWDELSWWALTLLHGIDLPDGPGGGHLHDGSRLSEWLDEFRRRRGHIRLQIHHIAQTATGEITAVVRCLAGPAHLGACLTSRAGRAPDLTLTKIEVSGRAVDELALAWTARVTLTGSNAQAVEPGSTVEGRNPQREGSDPT